MRKQYIHVVIYLWSKSTRYNRKIINFNPGSGNLAQYYSTWLTCVKSWVQSPSNTKFIPKLIFPHSKRICLSMTGTFVFSSDWDWRTLFFESFLIDTSMSHEDQNLEPLSNLRNTRKLGPKSDFTKIQSLWPHSL